MNMISKVAPDGEAQRLRVNFRDRPLWQRAAIAGTPIVALVAAVTLWTSDPSPAAAPPTPQVTVAAPIERSVSLWDDYVGRFEASRTVEVRPRVSGQIVGIHFTDGAIVQKGQSAVHGRPAPVHGVARRSASRRCDRTQRTRACPAEPRPRPETA